MAILLSLLWASTGWVRRFYVCYVGPRGGVAFVGFSPGITICRTFSSLGCLSLRPGVLGVLFCRGGSFSLLRRPAENGEWDSSFIQGRRFFRVPTVQFRLRRARRVHFVLCRQVLYGRGGDRPHASHPLWILPTLRGESDRRTFTKCAASYRPSMFPRLLCYRPAWRL